MLIRLFMIPVLLLEVNISQRNRTQKFLLEMKMIITVTN